MAFLAFPFKCILDASGPGFVGDALILLFFTSAVVLECVRMSDLDREVGYR